MDFGTLSTFLTMGRCSCVVDLEDCLYTLSWLGLVENSFYFVLKYKGKECSTCQCPESLPHKTKLLRLLEPLLQLQVIVVGRG